MIEHLFHGDRKRALLSLHHHAERGAHKDHIDPRLVNDPGRGEIVRREHGDLLALGLLLVDIENGDLRHLLSLSGFGSCHSELRTPNSSLRTALPTPTAS